MLSRWKGRCSYPTGPAREFSENAVYGQKGSLSRLRLIGLPWDEEFCCLHAAAHQHISGAKR